MELITFIGIPTLFLLTVIMGVRLLMARTERLDKKWNRQSVDSLPSNRPVQMHFTSIKANDPS
jgi:hypothetical protein